MNLFQTHGLLPAIRYDVQNGVLHNVAILNPDLFENHHGMVYARVINDEVAYVGKCERTLRRRFKEHESLVRRNPNKGEMFVYMNGKTVTWFARPVPDGGAASEEIRLLRNLKPRFNKRIG